MHGCPLDQAARDALFVFRGPQQVLQGMWSHISTPSDQVAVSSAVAPVQRDSRDICERVGASPQQVGAALITGCGYVEICPHRACA